MGEEMACRNDIMMRQVWGRGVQYTGVGGGGVQYTSGGCTIQAQYRCIGSVNKVPLQCGIVIRF